MSAVDTGIDGDNYCEYQPLSKPAEPVSKPAEKRVAVVLLPRACTRQLCSAVHTTWYEDQPLFQAVM
jgi:hypothetical protein